MDHPIGYGLAGATEDLQQRTAEEVVDRTLQQVRPQLIGAVRTFLSNPVSAISFFTLEIALLGLTREMGRLVVESVLNALAPENAELLPRNVWFECDGYRRNHRKT